jgi:PAS domain S-box-containing protein
MADRRLEEASWQFAALIESTDDAIVGTDLDGIITSWNAGAEKLYGYSSDAAIGQPIALIFPPDRTNEDDALLRRARAGEQVRDLETVRRRQDGSDVIVSITLSPIRTDSGDVIGTLRIARDISRRRRDERAARRLAAIVASSDDAIVSKDLRGIVTSWNRAAEQMFGYTAAEIIGRSIRAIIPADRQAEEDHVLASISRGEKVDHFDTVRRRKDGSLIPISLTVSPIIDEDGTVIGASKIARDISERREAEAERNRLLALSQQNARVTQTLNQVGTVVSSTLDRRIIIQAVTDAATAGTHADFGAFFYNIIDEQSGQDYELYALSGVLKDAFAKSPPPEATPLFGPAFHEKTLVRIDDVLQDPRLAGNPPFRGLPPGHPPVRSYLAAPVKARSGEVLGGLFFGHSEVGQFTEEDERLVAGISVWASVALENARLYAEVQESSRLKDEFLATLSHELRTPLNALLGYARMIRSGVIAAEGHRRAVETIERNAMSLSQIVEDILDVSRIISGKIRLNVQTVDLPKVIGTAVEAMMPAATAKNIKIDLVMDPRAAPISGDPERLQQVAWNLMTNAVKFTPPGGRVQVRLERVNSHIEIVVSDTGIGIRPDFLPHIFERFRQADSGTNRERGGLGLGLGIARQLVELHGGTIEATSAGVGQGSTFRVKLPLMIVHPIASPKDRVHPLTSGLQPPESEVPNLNGIRVLAVDDDRDALEMVKVILEATGAYVAVADSASSALEILEIVKPDVLVLDLGMPRMDGFELLAQIRRSQDAAVRDIPAAALTALARTEDRTRTLRSGFQMHLAKPIDPAELMAATAALAKRSGHDIH